MVDKARLSRTKHDMFMNGASFRSYRENAGLSQARIAEASGIPQYVLSAFELGKAPLKPEAQKALQATLEDTDATTALSSRRKRYRKHSYSARAHKPDRVRMHSVTPGNAAYKTALTSITIPQNKSFSGISLFSGCGGLSAGFRSAGCDIRGFVEIDDGLSSIYGSNFPGTKRLGSCIQEVTSDDMSAFAKAQGGIDVLLGGPPCQGFSLAGKRKIDDPRNELFRDYIRLLDAVRPKAAILENVRLLTSMRNSSGLLVKDDIHREFSGRGYSVAMFEINAKDYGVPQHRERVIFMAVDQALFRNPSMPQPLCGSAPDLLSVRSEYRTFADACSDLMFLESGENDERDPLHMAVSHPDHVLEWLWNVPQGCSAHENDDPALRPASGYNTTYKRQVWNEPGATVQTTFGMISGCRNVHPIATRSLTAREAARLQSFPDDYKFSGSLDTIRTGIGNAVPPLLAREIASHLQTLIF